MGRQLDLIALVECRGGSLGLRRGDQGGSSDLVGRLVDVLVDRLVRGRDIGPNIVGHDDCDGTQVAAICLTVER